MIAHLRGRDRKLEPLGCSGQHAEWIALVCLHSGDLHAGAVLSLLQHATDDGKPYCERIGSSPDRGRT